MSEVFRLWGIIKTKPKGHGPTLEEVWPDHPIRSSIAIFKLPLGCDILKKNNNKKKKEEEKKIEEKKRWKNAIF